MMTKKLFFSKPRVNRFKCPVCDIIVTSQDEKCEHFDNWTNSNLYFHEKVNIFILKDGITNFKIHFNLTNRIRKILENNQLFHQVYLKEETRIFIKFPVRRYNIMFLKVANHFLSSIIFMFIERQWFTRFRQKLWNGSYQGQWEFNQETTNRNWQQKVKISDLPNPCRDMFLEENSLTLKINWTEFLSWFTISPIKPMKQKSNIKMALFALFRQL